MEPPKSHHIVMFSAAMISALLALSFLIFVAYTFPYVAFGLVYNVPELVVQLTEYYQTQGEFGAFMTVMMIFLPFLIASFVLLYLARRLTSRLEHMELDPTLEPDQLNYEEEHHFSFSSIGPAASEIMLIVGVVALLFIIEYLIVIDLLD